jgi:hypothetical protein
MWGFDSLNLDPTAFVPWGSNSSLLPAQIKFRIALECPPISIQDPELVFSLGASIKTMGAIGLKETKAIANLFARRSPSYVNNNSKPAFTGGSIGSNTGYYKPPFKFSEAVIIDLQASLYEIKKKLLGTNASTIIQLVDEIGSKSCIRIRMRGAGSGFLEGPNQQELPVFIFFYREISVICAIFRKRCILTLVQIVSNCFRLLLEGSKG